MNKGPDMSAKNDVDHEIKTKVISDLFKQINIIDKNGESIDFYKIY
jgi:hypothetical protein